LESAPLALDERIRDGLWDNMVGRVASWGEGKPVGLAGRGGQEWQVIEGMGDGVS
jgi:hypothetical protein